jgi:hypothetical protein
MTGPGNIPQPDITRLLARLRGLSSGAADTCTIIYLEKCGLLDLAADAFQLLVPPGVVAEFGRPLPGCILCSVEPTPDTDSAVLALALDRGIPLLSEDGRLLNRCRRKNIPHYNTLMLLLALLVQGKIDTTRYLEVHRVLLDVARYSPAVRQVGDHVFSLFMR